MLRTIKLLLNNKPIQFFALKQGPIVSPLLTVLDDNPDIKNMPINTFIRTGNQNRLMDQISLEVSAGWKEIIEACRPYKSPATRGVIITPEYSTATFPFSERQFDSMIDNFDEYLKTILEPWDFYFASTFVHLTGDGKYLKHVIPQNADPQSPDILNVALLARRIIDLDAKENTTIVQVHYKQIIAANDLLKEYAQRPSLTEIPDLNRSIYSNKEGVVVGEICLESQGSVGFNTVAYRMFKKEIPIDAVGYHILSSDSIEANPTTSAYPIYVHVDARLPPKVIILTKEDQEQYVDVQKSFPIKSSNSHIANGRITLFNPITLQPARAKVIESIEELEQAENDPPNNGSTRPKL